jgi:hypothetical protein
MLCERQKMDLVALLFTGVCKNMALEQNPVFVVCFYCVWTRQRSFGACASSISVPLSIESRLWAVTSLHETAFSCKSIRKSLVSRLTNHSVSYL